MDPSQLSTYTATTVMLTDRGRIALGAEALIAAGKCRNEKRRKALCEQAMNYLRTIVQHSGSPLSGSRILHKVKIMPGRTVCSLQGSSFWEPSPPMRSPQSVFHVRGNQVAPTRKRRVRRARARRLSAENGACIRGTSDIVVLQHCKLVTAWNSYLNLG